MAPKPPSAFLMGFAERLATLRKERGLTQLQLAEKAGLHVVQVRRYETSASEPSLEALRKLAIALNVGADALVFAADERAPGKNLELHFEAVSQLEPDEQQVILEVIEGLLLKHQAKRWGTARRLGDAPETKPTRRRANG
jgi:transcriptional regulator with XRE-family HTH domain